MEAVRAQVGDKRVLLGLSGGGERSGEAFAVHPVFSAAKRQAIYFHLYKVLMSSLTGWFSM